MGAGGRRGCGGGEVERRRLSVRVRWRDVDGNGIDCRVGTGGRDGGKWNGVDWCV